LPEKAVVIMSMAQEHYFRPMTGYNFFRTTKIILDKIPNAYLMIVGINKNCPFVPVEVVSHPRVLLTGYVQKPVIQFQASDIILESFPMPSLGSVTEGVAFGEAFPVPVYGPDENILRVQRSVAPFPYRPPNEESYVEYVADLVKDLEETRSKARKMRSDIEKNDKFFENHLLNLYQIIDSLKHSPIEIPAVEKIETDDCRTLAETDQTAIGEKIDELFPIICSSYYQFEAALRRYQTLSNAIISILNRTKTKLSQRIS
jgi:hypothetical protein